RLTSTIIWISRRFAPGGANRRPIRLPGFQGGEISVVKILAVGTRSRRGTGTSRSSRLLLRGRGLRLRRLDLEDRRRDEHDQLTARGLRGRLLEQPPDDGNIAEERDLPRLVLVQVRRDAAADGRVRDFFTERDRGSAVFHGDDLGARQRPRLAEQA